ncbi:MAG: HemK family protein methyltransferase, partial [Methylococcales bacterium]|nr:HemK family protein methyltransferase [Methylococcales bacterium]
IALTLAAERPNWHITATDISPQALAQAQQNAQCQSIDHITWLHSDWFSALSTQRFDIIVSNPPYLSEHTPHWQQGDLRFEPYQALVSGPDGLDALRTIINQAPAHLSSQGWLLCEHGHDQQVAVTGLMHEAGFTAIQTVTDYARLPRLSYGQLPA